jgi:integrase/recombinase XerD
MGTPLITVFVRHSEGCKYAEDEFSKRCQCRKHFRWTQDGKQYRRQAGTRSWTEAEEAKQRLADELAGRTPAAEKKGKMIGDAVAVFIQDKQVQGVSGDVIGKYTRELARMQRYCEAQGVLTVQRIDRELMTGFCSGWASVYPSTMTRSKVRERLRGFFRYCFEAQWIERVPALPKITVDSVPTLPLTPEQFAGLLAAIPEAVKRPYNQARARSLYLLMRWSGLAIQDALTLPKTSIKKDAEKGYYRVVTSRQKTGVHVSVPIAAPVAEEILATPNDSDAFIFWDGKVLIETHTRKFTRYYVRPVFEKAGLLGDGFMTSHRLRDTFAVDLLEKGVPLEEVSKLLGHESIKTTEKHYAKWVKGRQDRLEALVVGTWDAA